MTPAMTSSNLFMAGFYYREAFSVDRGLDLGPPFTAGDWPTTIRR